jgi:hypothetical protein
LVNENWLINILFSPHVGCWRDDHNLAVNWSGMYEGKQSSEEILLTWLSNDQIRIHEIDSMENQALLPLDYVVKRKT